MRRPVIALVVLLVPGLAAADPTPVRVAAAPGATEPVGPGGIPIDAEPGAVPASSFAPPGMAAVDVPAPPPPASAAQGLAVRNAVDAASDRAYAMGTALTLPSGAFELSWRGPIGVPVGMAGISAGLGGRVELGVDVLYASVDDDGGTIGGGSIKVQVARGARTALALHGRAWSLPGEDAVVGLVGGIVSTCIGADCGIFASVHVSAVIASDIEDNDENETPIVIGGSLVAGRDTWKLLAELNVAEIDHERGVLGIVGPRIGGRHVAFDIGIGFAVADDGGGAFPMGALAIRP